MKTKLNWFDTAQQTEVFQYSFETDYGLITVAECWFTKQKVVEKKLLKGADIHVANVKA